MEPTIQDGAPILVEVFAYEDDYGNVRYLHSGNTPRDVVKRDGIYVVRLDDKLLVKRLQLDMLGGLLVKSDNQTYDTLHIPAGQIEEIAVIGRVVWTGRKL
ncbi:Peptidase S24-like protein [compost metagenome]